VALILIISRSAGLFSGMGIDMNMIAALALLFVGFGATLAVLFIAFISGIAAGERIGSAEKVVSRRR
jgi:hypothetical protein